MLKWGPQEKDSAFGCPSLLSFFPSEQNPFLLGWRFSQPLPFIALYSGFLDVPVFCSWIVTFQAFWFSAAPLGTWEGHIYSSFLVFCGTPPKLSQSHISCAARPNDPGPLVSRPSSFTEFCWIFKWPFLFEIWTYIGPWCWFFLLHKLGLLYFSGNGLSCEILDLNIILKSFTNQIGGRTNPLKSSLDVCLALKDREACKSLRLVTRS